MRSMSWLHCPGDGYEDGMESKRALHVPHHLPPPAAAAAAQWHILNRRHRTICQPYRQPPANWLRGGSRRQSGHLYPLGSRFIIRRPAACLLASPSYSTHYPLKQVLGTKVQTFIGLLYARNPGISKYLTYCVYFSRNET